MNFKQFKSAILSHFDKIQNESGEEFLELLVDTIVLQDEDENEIDTLNGWEYNLSRSRHWDKEEEIYIMYDGFSDEHLEEIFEDILDYEIEPVKIILNVDGMNDLDEPIHKQVTVELKGPDA
jgi:hypothetical protein